jgi:cytochrome c oxidase cbb3-type subunit III
VFLLVVDLSFPVVPLSSFSIAVLVLVIYGVAARAQDAGQRLFGSTCAACHGLDGRGGEHAPNIATDAKIQALSDRNLLQIVRSGIPSAGMPGFGSSLDETRMRAVVKYLRTLQGQGKAVSVTGDAEHGHVLFFGGAGCSACHTVNGEGGFLGADLSAYGSTHTPAEIRAAIADPNTSPDPRHGTVLVVTRSGTKYTGIIRNEDNFSLQMQTGDGSFHFFDKSTLARVEHSERSLMPSQYQSQLGDNGLDDLVSYLVKAAGTRVITAAEDEDQ